MLSNRATIVAIALRGLAKMKKSLSEAYNVVHNESFSWPTLAKMSILNKMSIQGIRSFGSDDSGKQMIEFRGPLTLILGRNGTGKTTIIECLKYITTGEVPPNTGHGSYFVLDPKVANQSEVLAQVRLKFRDSTGKETLITRSCKTIQKQGNGKPTFTTLEAYIRRKDNNGKMIDLNRKCADINEEMINLLGVSKPVLTNIIFCHQEDSNWPLSEGKVLKTKFDEIFSATRYAKALTKLQEEKKNRSGQVKLDATHIDYLKVNKTRADDKQKELSKMYVRLSASEKDVKDIEDKLKPIENRLRELRRHEEHFFEVRKEIETKKARLLEMNNSSKSLSSRIKKKYNGSIDELINDIDKFSDKVAEEKKCLQLKMKENTEVERKHQAKQGEISKLLVVIGELESDHKRHLQIINERNVILSKLCQDCGITEFQSNSSTGLTNDNISSKIYSLEQFIVTTQEEIEEKKARLLLILCDQKFFFQILEERLRDIQVKVDKLKDQKSKLEQKESSRLDQVNANKAEIEDVMIKLENIDTSAAILDQIDDELSIAEQELDKNGKSFDDSAVQKEISTAENSLKDLNLNLDKTRKESSKARQLTEVRTKLDHLKKDRIAKDSSVKKLYSKHEETLIALLGFVPKENAKSMILEFLNEKSNEVNSQRNVLNASNIKLSKLETTRASFLDQISNLKNELNVSKDKIFNVCGSQPYSTVLKALEESIDALQKATADEENSDWSTSGDEPSVPLRTGKNKIAKQTIKEDRVWKLRPWLDSIRGNFVKASSEEHQSVQEIMMAFNGLMKQYNQKQNFDFLQVEKGAVTGSRFLYKKFIEKLQNSSPSSCPLCHREFDDPTEASVLANELNDLVKTIPSRMTEKTNKLTTEKTKYNDVLQIKPIEEMHSKLSNADIPELEKKIKKIEKEIEELRQIISEGESSLSTVMHQESSARSISNDMGLLDQFQIELKKLNQQISSNSSMFQGDSVRTLQEIENDQQQIESKMNLLRQSIQSKKEQRDQYKTSIFECRDKITKLKEERQSISETLNQKLTLEESKAKLIANNKQLASQILRLFSMVRTLSKNELTKVIDVGVKNRFNWAWLEHAVSISLDLKVVEPKLGHCIGKIDVSGKTVCHWCGHLINYSLHGRVALMGHVESAKHKKQLKPRWTNYSLESFSSIRVTTTETSVGASLVPVGDRVSQMQNHFERASFPNLIHENLIKVLLAMPESTFPEAFKKWENCWEWCIASRGDYFEGDSAYHFKKTQFHFQYNKEAFYLQINLMFFTIQDAKNQMEPVENNLRLLEAQKTKQFNEKEKFVEQKYQESDMILSISPIEAEEDIIYFDIIKYYIENEKENILRDKNDKLIALKQSIEEFKGKSDKLKATIDDLKQRINQQEIHQRDLEDNLEIKKIVKEIRKLSEDVKQNEETYDKMDVDSFESEKNKLNKAHNSFFKDSQLAVGRQSELKESIRRLEQELKNPDYRDAVLKYNNKMIEMKTNEIAATDLVKYHDALDRALNQYHRVKMAAVNKIIRELWQLTYKGNDIDYIEIDCGEEPGNRGIKRNVYNYRVVLVKSNISLDMRGRCSAGQRVLASLIIRLALAETFCLQCGILTLDEPTTNLDRSNIESLAEALKNIVEMRSELKNFQLVIITHDEEFIELLGRGRCAEYFYKVSKNDQ
ncbi:DNA repair protein RAD50 [Nymphon striatum]|nr:DNA repair protein RAD50 [Nymphon striatum]